MAVINGTVGEPAGSATWASSRPLTAWAEIAVVHRAGAEMGHYFHAIELAKTHRRVLVIEAPAETFDGWLALVHERPRLAVEVLR